MVTEYSCGAVLFCRKDGVRNYVLVMEPTGSYGFPKGHMEGEESSLETAIREIKEETGITPTFIPNFKRTIRYKVGPTNEKEVTYFAAKYENQELSTTDEGILCIRLLPLEAALSILKFPELKNILIETDYMLELKGE